LGIKVASRYSFKHRNTIRTFSLDNNLNLRGVGNIIDRGTGTIVLNSEFRKTFYEKMVCTQGNAFDSGTWRKAVVI
jgi:hypothetical protein